MKTQQLPDSRSGEQPQEKAITRAEYFQACTEQSRVLNISRHTQSTAKQTNTQELDDAGRKQAAPRTSHLACRIAPRQKTD
jgi:hypothetical protein